jgi:hypothetical protein
LIAVEGSHETLAQFARRLLEGAKAEGQAGYAEHDAIKVRKAAERAWKAACAATDAAMASRGIPRDGTAADRVRHYEFLDKLNGGHLSLSYAAFADRLHDLCAHGGHLPSPDSWKRQLDAVEQFIAEVTAAGSPEGADPLGPVL